MDTKIMQQLLDEILKIPGRKIITLSDEDNEFRVDVDEQGNFGYEVGVKELFLAKVCSAMHSGGGMIIRQFLPVKMKRKATNGKEIWMPEKNLYAVALGEKTWRGCTQEQVEDFCETHHETGERLPKEEGVHYQDFAVLHPDC